ncbi:MAG: AMP-binding protein, partial [Candidatus Aminicenantes bacterium]|nr:AMP-binding protein [Candidatus Aminicenantes bacterium]
MITQDHLSRLKIAARRRVEERDYWLQQLAGALTGSGFPYDHTPLDSQAKSYETTHFSLPGELSAGLLKASAGSDTRLYIVLTAALTVLLYKYSGCENPDILVGSPILKQEVAGELINTVLALRNQIAGDMTFRDFLLQVRQTIIEADKHRNYPIELLMIELDLPNLKENSPLFAVAILLENIHDKHYLDQAAPDMLFSFSKNGGGISGRVEYDSLLFDKNTIERIIAHFENIMLAAITWPDAKIGELEMLSQAEKEQLLFHFNEAGTGYPINKTIHELFEIQASKTPDNIAVIGTAAGSRRGRGKRDASAQHDPTFSHGVLTYKELNEAADRLSYSSIAKGLKPGDIAAIMAERSLHIIVGILAVLKSGAAYLPVNPQQPISRSKYIIQDCCVGLLLTTGSMLDEAEQLKSLKLETIFIGDRSSETASLPAAADRSPSANNPANNAYIIYTSGSTGIPKGVPIAHANYCPLIHWGCRQLGISPADRVIQNLSYYFDWSVWEIFIALTCGASLYMITEEILLDPQAEVDFILENEITVLHITPTQYSYLIETGKRLTSLKYLFIGAEKLTSDLLQRSIESV